MSTSETAPAAEAPRHDWTDGEIAAIHELPLTELVFRAQVAHRRHHDPTRVQLCTLLSIKTGACPEDCAYCPQSVRYQTGVAAEPLMAVAAVREHARASGRTISSVAVQALEEFLHRAHGDRPGR